MTPETKGNIIGLAFVAIIAAIGLYVVMTGLGRFGRSDGDAPSWVLIAAGSAFLLAASSMALSAIGGIVYGAKANPDGSLTDEAPYAVRALQILLSLGIVAMLVAVASWVALNPEEGSATGRRIALAAGAITVWAIFFGFVIWRLRGLRK